MGLPRLMVENLWSTIQFPLHTLAVTEEASGHEQRRMFDARRSVFDYWTPNSTNTQMDHTLTMDRVRTCDYVALDRGHNLAGKTVELHAAQVSDFSSFETVFSIALPTAAGPGSLDDGLGVRTEEGAWLIHFSPRAARYLRFRVAAMGASQKPSIVGLYTGLSWAPPGLYKPFNEDANELIAGETQSDLGWIGRFSPVVRRRFTLNIKLSDFATYDQARYHVGGHFAANRPMWICHDDQQAERTLLAVRDGDLRWTHETDWGYRRAMVGWVEHEHFVP